MFKLIDLFSGAGGMTLGFTSKKFCAGFKSVWAVDHDLAALETYRANFCKPFDVDHVVHGDIERIIREQKIPKADVVIGGPPCQGFSLLNKQRKGDVRRELWQPYMDVVEASKASVFVIENVQHLFGSPEMAEIQACAERMGFKSIGRVLNTADFGVPQARKRTVILGWKKKLSAPSFPPLPSHKAPGTLDGRNLPVWLTVKDAIGDLPEPVGTEIRDDEEEMLRLHFGRSPTALSLKRYSKVPYGGNRFDLQERAPKLTPKCWIRKTSGGTDLFGRLWWERPSVTIRTEFFKPEKGRYLHPVSNRPITHREAARLMGFPDDFVFKGTKIQIARQIGNAVPPPLASAIASVVAEILGSRQTRSKAA